MEPTTEPTTVPTTEPPTEPTTEPTEAATEPPETLATIPGEPQVGPLSDDELEYFQTLFRWKNKRGANWYHYATICVYEDPTEIDLYELFLGNSETVELTDDDIAFLNSIGKPTENPPSMIHKYTIAGMDAVLQEYFGVTYDECDGIGLEKFIYNPECACYYDYHGGLHESSARITGGERLEDGTVLIHFINSVYIWGEETAMTITLIPTENGYQIASNVLDLE